MVYYRENSEHSQAIDEFLFNLREGRGFADIEEIDIDSKEAQVRLSLRDIVNKPVLMVEAEDGTVTKVWQGPQLPALNDVMSYLMH